MRLVPVLVLTKTLRIFAARNAAPRRASASK